MFRIRDPKASLDFYTRALGMTLLDRLDFQDMSFSLYFLGYTDPSKIPTDRKERVQWMFSQPSCLELTHNWGTETDPEFKVGPEVFAFVRIRYKSMTFVLL